MLERRTLIGGVGGGLLTVSFAAFAQRHRVRRIGVLFFGSSNTMLAQHGVPLFRQTLHDLGHVEGKTIAVEERYAGGNAQRLAELAREFAARKVDVIVASAVTAAIAARQATSTIPIVMVHAGNAEGAGLISSLARPGGNVTGTTNLPIGGKLIDLARELLPHSPKLAILANPKNVGAASHVAAMTDGARKWNINVVVVELSRSEDLPVAFAAIRNARPDGLLIAVEPLIGLHETEIIEFAASNRLPVIYDNGSTVRRGGLIAYSTLYIEHYKLAASYVDKILKGAKPADLPVQQPARFELVVNMKTAKALGIAISHSILLRADEIIH